MSRSQTAINILFWVQKHTFVRKKYLGTMPVSGMILQVRTIEGLHDDSVFFVNHELMLGL